MRSRPAIIIRAALMMIAACTTSKPSPAFSPDATAKRPTMTSPTTDTSAPSSAVAGVKPQRTAPTTDTSTPTPDATAKTPKSTTPTIDTGIDCLWQLHQAERGACRDRPDLR